MKHATGIIPARFGSQRFPGKPLAKILGKPMLQRVYEKALSSKHLNRVIIATDDEKIFDTSKSFGADVYMTSPEHNSGTERVAEIAEKIEDPIIINIQGDEPLLKGKMIDSLVESLQDDTINMSTLAFKQHDLSLFNNRNSVKVVIDQQGFALYFSRSPIPSQIQDYYWLHIGIYGYQREFLLNFRSLNTSRLEQNEKLEQLRVLENGYKIKVIETQYLTLSVDSPEDIIKVENILKKEQNA